MSELNIKIRKVQDNGSAFKANPDTLYLGGMRSAKVDRLHFEVPEEWKACTISLHVQRLSGTLPDPQILDENNSVLVDRRWTLEAQGRWMLLAMDENGYIAMSKPGQYTCYETIDTDSTTEALTPSIYEQFVAQVTRWANAAKESMTAAAGSAKKAGEEADRAEQAVADLDQTRTDSIKAVQDAQSTATTAVEQKKTDAVKVVQNAQTTATTAVQQAQSTATDAVAAKQTEAVQAVETAQAAAIQAVDDERDAALQQVADSTQAAQTAASDAATAANAAGNAATAAGGYASNAESSATAASGSASAAATSESNAATSAENSESSAARSEAAAKKAEAVIGTDKTLTVEGAPADSKAVGDALDINKLIETLDVENDTPNDSDYFVGQHVNGENESAVSYRRKPLSALWNWIKVKLGSAAFKTARTLTSQGPSGWKDATTDQQYVPDMAFMAYWNGAYSGTASNLAYCNQGAFGSIVKVAARKNHNTSDSWIPVWSGDNLDYILKSEMNVNYANGSGNVQGFWITAQTGDPGAWSNLDTNRVLLVYE